MTITEYNEIFSYPIVKELTLTFTSQNQGQAPIILTNEDICSEEMSLEEAICSDENLRYGACEASCFKVRVVNSSSFKGMDLHVSMKIKVDDNKYLIDADGNRIVTADGDYIILNVGKKDDYINLGHYKVFSDELSNDRMWRDLVCYDYMYDILNAEMSDWYNFISTVHGFPMSLKTFRDSFFEWLDITALIFPDGQVTQTLVNDSFMVNGGFIAEGSLSGKTIIEAICELNGCFGHINRSGKFEYIDLTETSSIAPLWYINDDSGKYEDYTVNHITGIIARSEASDIGTSVGTMANPLIIEGNPLIYGMEGTQALTTALTNILSMVSGLTYRPFKVNTYGNPMLPIGTPITINTKKYDTVNGYQPFAVNSIVSKRVLTGIQGMVDSYEATGTELRGNEANSLQSQIIRTAGKVHDLKVDLDTFESYIRDQNYSTRINQNAQAITLEAQRAQSQEEVAGVMTRYEVDTTDPNDPIIDIYTNITLTHFSDGTRIALWIKGIPNQYSSYRKRIMVAVVFDPQSQIYNYDLSDAYYSGTDYLKDQYKEGVIYHLMYMQNQLMEKEGVSDYYTGWWIGADDSYAKISVTADEIRQEVSSGYVDINSYNSEIQNLQNQIDGYIEYWDGDNVVPTLQNYPANDWVTAGEAELGRHVGDLYRNHYTQTVGTSTVDVTDYYRFDRSIQGTSTVYSWALLGAGDVDEALRKADEANAKAEAAQSQLDALEASTTTQFASVTTRINGVTTRVSGVEKVSPVAKTFNGSVSSYSDGKLFVFTEDVTTLGNGNRFSILLPSHWNDYSTYNKYIKITSSGNPNPNTNTFPVYYSGTTKLTNQLGAGDTLNIRYYEIYSYITGANKKAFVIENSDQTYQRLETELNVERGRIVMRAEATSGGKSKLVSARFDATGESSEIYLGADSIILSAEEAMSFLSGGTLTLAGENGVVIDSPNFKVRRDESVAVKGALTALTLATGSRTSASEGEDGIFIDSSGNLYAGDENQTQIFANGTLNLGNGLLTYDGETLAIQGDIIATSLTLADNVTIDADDIDGLATVAKTGSYSSLSGKPDLSIYITSTTGEIRRGTVGSGSTGINIPASGRLECSNAIVYGALYSSEGTIAGLTITSTALQKSSSNSGFSLSADSLYFSSGANEANTMNVMSTGLSTKGYIEAEVIRRKDASGKWAGINRDLNTSLNTINNKTVNPCVIRTCKMTTASIPAGSAYTGEKTALVSYPSGYTPIVAILDSTGSRYLHVWNIGFELGDNYQVRATFDVYNMSSSARSGEVTINILCVRNQQY